MRSILWASSSASSSTCRTLPPSPRPWTINTGWGGSRPICSTILRMAGDPDHALASGQRALAIGTALGDVGLTVVAQNYLGYVYRSLGDYRQAVEYFQEERGVSPRRAAAMSASVCLVWLRCTLAAASSPPWPSVAPSPRGGLLPRKQSGSPRPPITPTAVLMPIGVLAFCALRKGDFHQAIPMLERLLDLVQVTHLRLWIPRASALLGAAYALAGRTAEALPLLEQAVEQAGAMRSLADHALQMAWLSEAYLLAGRLDEAHAQAQRALDVARPHKERGYEAYALRLPRRGCGAAPAAGGRTRPKPTTTRPSPWPKSLACARCRRTATSASARCMPRLGQPEQARAALSAAIDLYRAMEMTFWLPQAEAALAQIA